MDPAPPAPSPAVPPSPVPSAVLATWPPSGQWAAAFLLGVAVTLLAVHAYGYSRWGSRPTELERDAVRSYRIDLNKAGRAELLQIPGVGESLAARILNFRREHGGFESLEQLTEVSGIGPSTLERLRPWLRVGPAKADEAAAPRMSGGRTSEMGTPAISAQAPGGKKAASLTEPIDINRATQEELQRLPGIGPKLSERILDERRKGPFRSVEELRRVPGIGPKTLERLRPFIRVDEPSTRVVRTD